MWNARARVSLCHAPVFPRAMRLLPRITRSQLHSYTHKGGVEGYTAMFAQLQAVHEFAPEAKTISIISDAGSGFKSTACAFGLMWASHLGLLPGGLRIEGWMYPATGEAKQPETDGAMPR